MTELKATGVSASPFLGRRAARAKSAAAAPPPKPRRQPSLVRRLVVLHAVLSAIVLAIGGVTLSAFFAERSTAAFDERLGDDVLDLVRGTSVDETGEVAAPTLTDARTGYAYSGKYWELVTPGEGGPVHAIDRSRSMWDAPDFALPAGGAPALASRAGKTFYYDGMGPAPSGGASAQPGAPAGKEHVRIAAELVHIAGVKDPIIFMVAEDRSPIDANIRTFAVSVAIALAALLAMLIGGVMLQVRFGLRPLFRLQREVASVRTGKTDRVGDDYPAELEPLASELNALVAHNQEVVERQRTHVGNLAHALKTPLTVMDAEAQARPGPLGDVVRRQVDVMREQVDHHLRRARASARQQGGGDRTEVAPLLEELALTLERIFQDKGVEIDWRAPDDLFFHGERQDLLELAGNVMENACKWCKARVRVTAEALDATRFSLTVEDDGPGLAAKDRAEVLQRGARLDETAPGSGLGLSIVDELARAYGGALALSDSHWGGLMTTLTLPRGEA
ncbi:MAG TPA: ATP-binding protein [Caulobacteraceae bacterium]|nr:ATP-binding protein [Caulobacteraceae bacterium]